MNQGLSRLLLCCLMLLAARGVLAEPLVVAVNNNDRPFCWTDERGELTGFSVDVARAICRTMGAECVYTPTTFADFIPGVREGRFDFVVANVLRTAAREQLVDFTHRFWQSSSMFLGRPGIVGEISTAALAGKRVGVQKGSAQEKYLQEKFAGVASILSYTTNVERNAALAAGEVDLIFGSSVSHYAFLATPQGAGFDFIGSPLDGNGLGGDVAIPVAKGREALRERLDSAIDALQKNGTLEKLRNVHFLFTSY
jgi:ABC-type amino acid transport substrate-binding protein